MYTLKTNGLIYDAHVKKVFIEKLTFICQINL